jgi:hypothetical protein
MCVSSSGKKTSVASQSWVAKRAEIIMRLRVVLRAGSGNKPKVGGMNQCKFLQRKRARKGGSTKN